MKTITVEKGSAGHILADAFGFGGAKMWAPAARKRTGRRKSRGYRRGVPMSERFMGIRLLHEPHSLVKMQDRAPMFATVDKTGLVTARARTPAEKRRWARNRLKGARRS